jgi:hypothetical protein
MGSIVLNCDEIKTNIFCSLILFHNYIKDVYVLLTLVLVGKKIL